MYFLVCGRVISEDLGILPAEPALLAWLRDACRSDAPPVGVPGVLHVFSDVVTADRGLAAVFAGVPPSVLDVADDSRTVARLIVSKGVVSVFTGLGRDYALRVRGPDVTSAPTPPRWPLHSPARPRCRSWSPTACGACRNLPLRTG